jgi:hypothetical protein
MTTTALNTIASGGCPLWFASAPSTGLTSAGRSVSTGAQATSWIPINLSLISSGAPIGQWPIDPAFSVGTASTTGQAAAGHMYSYVTTSTNNGYKLAAKMESALYSSAGTGDLESTDGGVDANMYEQGTNLAL